MIDNDDEYNRILAFKKLIGKPVEVYTGNSFGSLSYSESITASNSVIVGKLSEIDQECIIVECSCGNLSNKIYINSRQVVGIIDITKNIGINDVYNLAE